MAGSPMVGVRRELVKHSASPPPKVIAHLGDHRNLHRRAEQAAEELRNQQCRAGERRPYGRCRQPPPPLQMQTQQSQ